VREMKGDRLYDVIEFILNEASEQELEVVRSALKRRVEGKRAHGAMGVDPGRIARRTASSIREQLGLSIDQIRSMVTSFAAETLKKQAPELTDAQIHELLDSWIPENREAQAGSDRGSEDDSADRSPASESAVGESKKTASRGKGRAPRKGTTRLKPDVILTMVTQFLAYGDESMSVSEQVKLNQEIPDWQRRYWEQFSPRIRELLSLHLRGEIDRATCLERVCADLGIDADFSK